MGEEESDQVAEATFLAVGKAVRQRWEGNVRGCVWVGDWPDQNGGEDVHPKGCDNELLGSEVRRHWELRVLKDL